MKLTDLNFEAAYLEEQLQVFFQPIADLQTGMIVAIEGKVRWETTEHSLLTAGDILAYAAESGKQEQLDFLVLAQSAQALHELKDSLAPPINIAVDIATATCLEPGFIGRIEAFFESGNLPVQPFRLEFPQEALIAQPGIMSTMISALSKSGFEIAIDHVSNPETVASLAAVPVSTVKLEARLVGELPTKPEAVSRTKALLMAANQLGLRTAAEGISRLEQLEFLRQAGCHEGQGPLISKPRPIGELIFLIKRGRCW